MSIPLTITFTAAFALLFVLFAIPVVALRARLAAPFGDGGHPELARAIRAHANFAEYAPLMLLALAAMELSGASTLVVGAAGAVFVLGRGLYAAYFYGRQHLGLRIAAFWCTVLPLALGALIVLF